MLEKRSLKEWCGGCQLFSDNRCETPMLNRRWRACPCRDCLLKSVCLELCDELQNHKNEVIKRKDEIIKIKIDKKREIWMKNHGGVGEAG